MELCLDPSCSERKIQTFICRGACAVEGRCLEAALKCLLNMQSIYSAKGFPGGTSSKESSCQCRRCKRRGFDPCLGRSSGEANGNPLQYSCLENPMDRRTWWATVHGTAKSQTQLSDLARMHTYTYSSKVITIPDQKQPSQSWLRACG